MYSTCCIRFQLCRWIHFYCECISTLSIHYIILHTFASTRNKSLCSNGYRYLCLDTKFCFILWRTYLSNRCHNRDTCGVDQSLIGAHQVSLISKPWYGDTVYCGHKPYPLIQSQVIANYIYWVIWECTPSEGWNVIPGSCLSLKPGTTSMDEIVTMTTYLCLYYIHIMIRLGRFVWYPLVRKGTIDQFQHVNPKKQLIFMCNKVFF